MDDGSKTSGVGTLPADAFGMSLGAELGEIVERLSELARGRAVSDPVLPKLHQAIVCLGSAVKVLAEGPRRAAKAAATAKRQEQLRETLEAQRPEREWKAAWASYFARAVSAGGFDGKVVTKEYSMENPGPPRPDGSVGYLERLRGYVAGHPGEGAQTG